MRHAANPLPKASKYESESKKPRVNGEPMVTSIHPHISGTSAILSQDAVNPIIPNPVANLEVSNLWATMPQHTFQSEDMALQATADDRLDTNNLPVYTYTLPRGCSAL
jgi:hypothetical protein